MEPREALPRSRSLIRKVGARAHMRAPPDFVLPMLAKLSSRAPRGDEWVHEVKFDGYRLQARIDGGRVVLRTRKGLDWTERFGDPLIRGFMKLKCKNALIDGEVVVEDEQGRSGFTRLVDALRDGRRELFAYWAFDLMFLN